MKGRVCVLGSFNVDVVANVPRFPQPGESLIARGSSMGAGGKGANQAMAALRAGARVHYIGKLGNDTLGDFARRHLDKAGFDACTLFTSDTAPTGNALVFVDGQTGENMIAVDPGANLTIAPAEMEQAMAAIEAADILLIQLENNLEAITAAVTRAHAVGTYVILNPAPYQPVDDRLLAMVDLLTPNQVEARLLSGIEVSDLGSARRAAKCLQQRGAKRVLITLGCQGGLLAADGQYYLIPRFPARAIDTTGAGDAFNGALAAALANHHSLAQAALLASAYAAVSVEREGAASAMPLLNDGLQRVADHLQLQVSLL